MYSFLVALNIIRYQAAELLIHLGGQKKERKGWLIEPSRKSMSKIQSTSEFGSTGSCVDRLNHGCASDLAGLDPSISTS